MSASGHDFILPKFNFFCSLDKYAEAHTEKEQEKVWKESGGVVEEKPKPPNIARVLINNAAVKMVHSSHPEEDKKKMKFLAAFSLPNPAKTSVGKKRSALAGELSLEEEEELKSSGRSN